ncbi:alpha/beta hydrolase family protein [Rhizoctonia solani]|uniref:Alpha/beta hydrolase family protein n=1 Tax=Rhizoctonia solani TaxID=456999 RepID=A0A8H8STJ7_9AGAM|nr:alpha/beta hydrolase family protein [Rhizoctonia solani]QRW17604.1 alpha/beta hydrolase family protein [Rhizoctonia solani]
MATSSTIPEDLLNKLAPGYREFAQANSSLLPRLHGIPWSPKFRQPPPNGPPDMGTEPPVAVGSQRVIDLGNYSVHVMIPDGEKPSAGWPTVLFFHGGGWVFGSADMNNGLLSRLCAKCAVVSVEYRLAPEHPFPAGLDDSWDALLWLRQGGVEQLGVDPDRIALMGISAGANLAAVVAQRASLSSPRIPLKLQILHIPVIDASFSVDDRSRWTQSMIEYEDIFSLPVFNMLWLRDNTYPTQKTGPNPKYPPYIKTILVLSGWLKVTHMGLGASRVCEAARDHRDELIAFVKESL